jgi:hypothetical protein
LFLNPLQGAGGGFLQAKLINKLVFENIKNIINTLKDMINDRKMIYLI